MATIKTLAYLGGKNVWTILLDMEGGKIFNVGSGSLEFWNDSNFSSYIVGGGGQVGLGSSPSSGYTGLYQWNLPLNLPAGVYALLGYPQAGASPTQTDMANGPIAIESGIVWTGGVTGTEVTQTGDAYGAMMRFGGMILTGAVAASPSPTASVFTVTLDALSQLGAGAVAADFITPPLYVTFRSGNNVASYSKITACTINSVSSVALTVNPAFSVIPVSADLVSISG